MEKKLFFHANFVAKSGEFPLIRLLCEFVICLFLSFCRSVVVHAIKKLDYERKKRVERIS